MTDTSPYQPTDRRPIAARGWTLWQRTANRMAARGMSANAISIAGMVFGLLAGAALASTRFAANDGSELLVRAAWLAGAACIQLRLLANLLDGMVAIASGRASAVGELYNEVPDRVSDTAVLVGLGLAAYSSSTLGWIAACAAMFTAYIRATGKAAGAPSDFRGPMAKQHRMALVTVIAIYCAVAPMNWQPVVGFELGRETLLPTRADSVGGRATIWWGVPAWALLVIIVGSIVTALRRLMGIARRLRTSMSA